jgi:hypothetical protein
MLGQLADYQLPTAVLQVQFMQLEQMAHYGYGQAHYRQVGLVSESFQAALAEVVEAVLT